MNTSVGKPTPVFNTCMSEIKSPIKITVHTENAIKKAELFNEWVLSSLKAFSLDNV